MLQPTKPCPKPCPKPCHIRKAALGYEGIHGGFGFGKRNIDGERILEFAVAKNLVKGNSEFMKKDNHHLLIWWLFQSSILYLISTQQISCS